MRVICIDNKPTKEENKHFLELIKEGKVYNGTYFKGMYPNKQRVLTYGEGWIIEEVDKICPNFAPLYKPFRFIPCSEIDETELLTYSHAKMM